MWRGRLLHPTHTLQPARWIVQLVVVGAQSVISAFSQVWAEAAASEPPAPPAPHWTRPHPASPPIRRGQGWRRRDGQGGGQAVSPPSPLPPDHHRSCSAAGSSARCRRPQPAAGLGPTRRCQASGLMDVNEAWELMEMPKDSSIEDVIKASRVSVAPGAARLIARLSGTIISMRSRTRSRAARCICSPRWCSTAPSAPPRMPTAPPQVYRALEAIKAERGDQAGPGDAPGATKGE